MKKGKRYLQPQQWFQLFAEGLQKAMKALNLGNGKPWKDLTEKEKQKILHDERIDQYLPDNITWTQHPDWRDESGRVLSLYWRSGDYRKVCARRNHPQQCIDYNLGTRPVLG